jgi:hydrogenase expression/formation protein HypC
MCLAVPGRILEIFEEGGLRMGRIDCGGTRLAACLEYVPEACVGRYAIVHAGFALSLLDEEEARETLALLERLAEAERDGPVGG